jgi:hypothetical protein
VETVIVLTRLSAARPPTRQPTPDLTLAHRHIGLEFFIARRRAGPGIEILKVNSLLVAC